MQANDPQVVVGQVVEVVKHPNGDFIRVAAVNVGNKTLTIVFGGSDIVRKGDLVPVALSGARLSGKPKIRARNWRGVRSEGMMCSSDELGWTRGGPDEVLILPGSCLVGQELLVGNNFETHQGALRETPTKQYIRRVRQE
jgi:phenylalanyl-tRNA synthetase beta chain